MLKPFVPEDYFQSMTFNQKNVLFRKIITNSLKNMILKIAQDHLNNIIDHHKDEDNVNILRDDLINCFLLEKDSMYKRFFLSETTNGNIKDFNINMMVLKEIKEQIKKLSEEKCKLKNKVNSLEFVKNKCLIEIKKYKENEEKYIEEIKKYKSEIK